MADVTRLSIKMVLEDHGVTFTKASGDTYNAVSPFRKNSSPTSFSISISRNCWRDWHKEIGGGVIAFIVELFHCSRRQAADYLKYKYFGIGQPVMGATYTKKTIDVIEPVKMPEISDPAILDKGYRILLSHCKLTDSARDYLKDRGITEDEMDQFKSYPSRAIKFKVLKSFEAESIDPLKLPGFYKDVQTGNITFMSGKESSILLPIKNADGQIVALQYRKEKKKPNEPRYSWFSSAKFIKPTDEGSNGSSPGCPVNVDYGVLKAPKTMFITEGFFKSLKIIKTWGNPVIAIQGVGNWKNGGTMDAIRKILDKYPSIERIIVAYDADFCQNANVATQASLLMQKISETFSKKVLYLSWKMDIGKGIDDFLEACGDPQKAEWKIWESTTFKKVVDETLAVCPMKDFSQEEKEEFKRQILSRLS